MNSILPRLGWRERCFHWLGALFEHSGRFSRCLAVGGAFQTDRPSLSRRHRLVHIHRLPLVLLAGAAALASSSTAYADEVSVSVGGGIHVGAGVHVNIDTAVDVLAHVDLGWGVVVDFADPPPPERPACDYDYDCEGAVPSYGVGFVEPVYVEPIYVEPIRVEPVHVHVDGGATEAPSRSIGSRWAVGAFAGVMNTEGMESGSDLGLLGQYRFTRAFALELELAKSKQDQGDRVDRRLGAALLYSLRPNRKLDPFLLAGAGYGQSEIAAGEFHAQQGYGEVGAGLRLKLTKSLHVVGDLRTGRRSGADEQVYMSKTATDGASLRKDEDYTRFRVGGLLTF